MLDLGIEEVRRCRDGWWLVCVTPSESHSGILFFPPASYAEDIRKTLERYEMVNAA